MVATGGDEPWTSCSGLSAALWHIWRSLNSVPCPGIWLPLGPKEGPVTGEGTSLWVQELSWAQWTSLGGLPLKSCSRLSTLQSAIPSQAYVYSYPEKATWLSNVHLWMTGSNYALPYNGKLFGHVQKWSPATCTTRMKCGNTVLSERSQLRGPHMAQCYLHEGPNRQLERDREQMSRWVVARVQAWWVIANRAGFFRKWWKCSKNW